MRIRVHALIFVAATLGCGQPQEGTGTNTNWLRTCASTSECGSLACSCGHCTPACTSDSDCAPLGGICSSADSTTLECQGTPSARLCLPRCSSSTECSSGQVCYRGACTHALAPANCADHPDALVCEDFEGALDAYQTAITSGNTAEGVTVATPSGARALEADVLVAPSTAYLRGNFAPLSTGSLSVRGWIQVPVGQTTYDLAPLAFWSDQEPAWALRVVAKDGQLQAWSYTTPLTGSAPISAGEWHCIEATIDIADAGRIQVNLDGVSVIDMSNTDTLPTGGIGALAMGTEWAGATATILVDRVLAGPTAAGCW